MVHQARRSAGRPLVARPHGDAHETGDAHESDEDSGMVKSAWPTIFADSCAPELRSKSIKESYVLNISVTSISAREIFKISSPLNRAPVPCEAGQDCRSADQWTARTSWALVHERGPTCPQFAAVVCHCAASLVTGRRRPALYRPAPAGRTAAAHLTEW